jgi:acetyl esterase
MHPRADPRTHNVDVIRDVPYLPSGSRWHTLDVYRPAGKRGWGGSPGSAGRGGEAPLMEPLPVVLYVHGGGFRILSKDTHWMMGIAFARRGYLVFNINYRLAPGYPYPAAIQDACAALTWVRDHAERFGGDADRLVLAGESAGANLVTALAVATSYRRPEPWARAVFDADIRARAVIPACGILQVSDPARFGRRKKLPSFLMDRIEEVADSYLGAAEHHPHGGIELADPLLILERGDAPDRSLPPVFTFVGTRDPLLDDTRRLHAALTRLGATCEIRYYPGEVHAFHAMVWRPQAIDCWRESFRFLNGQLGISTSASERARGPSRATRAAGSRGT